jgi:hypothetical protein
MGRLIDIFLELWLGELVINNGETISELMPHYFEKMGTLFRISLPLLIDLCPLQPTTDIYDVVELQLLAYSPTSLFYRLLISVNILCILCTWRHLRKGGYRVIWIGWQHMGAARCEIKLGQWPTSKRLRLLKWEQLLENPLIKQSMRFSSRACFYSHRSNASRPCDTK